jgi:hypothetical protein
MKRNAVIRSISHATGSTAGDAYSEYQKGAQSARGFLHAVFNRNAAGNARATTAASTPEHPEQQR